MAGEKQLAFICVTILGIGALLTFSNEGVVVVTHGITAIAGMVTGNLLK